MAFVPVEMTNGLDVIMVTTADDLVQFEWDGWVRTSSNYDPPLPDGSPGPAVPTTGDFIGMMNELFVRRDDLVIAPEPPATPKGPGTIHIDNSVS